VRLHKNRWTSRCQPVFRRAILMPQDANRILENDSELFDIGESAGMIFYKKGKTTLFFQIVRRCRIFGEARQAVIAQRIK
jgi:hypothetical protein